MLAQLTSRVLSGCSHGSLVPSCSRVPQVSLFSRQTVLNVQTYASPKRGGGPGPAPKAPPPPPVEPEIEEDDEDFDDQDVMDSLRAPAKRRVMALKEVQAKYDEVHRQYLMDLAVLQSSYLEKYIPFFDERRDIIAGKTKVGNYDVPDDGSEDSGIPDFWLDALANSKAGPFINERDADVLKYLTDIRSQVLTGDETGFKLVFYFAENPFFTNKTLMKTYLLEPEDDIIPKSFVGCKINWNAGKDVTVETIKKRNKVPKGAPKTAGTFTTEVVPCDSFFNIFDPPKVPTADEAEKMADDELDEIQNTLGDDYEIGYSIKEKVIARAVEWFTGEIAPLDDMEDYDDEGYEDGR